MEVQVDSPIVGGVALSNASPLIQGRITYLSTHPASYIQYCTDRLRRRDGYKCGAYEFFNSEQMIATLYILDKAD